MYWSRIRFPFKTPTAKNELISTAIELARDTQVTEYGVTACIHHDEESPSSLLQALQNGKKGNASLHMAKLL
jgi:hypothetical protein